MPKNAIFLVRLCGVYAFINEITVAVSHFILSKTCLSLLLYKTITLSSHQPTDIIMISLLSYNAAPVWFLPSRGALLSAYQNRGCRLSGSPLPPPPFPFSLNCPLTVNSSVSRSCSWQQSLGRVHPGAARRRRRAREVHLLWRSSRRSVRGPGWEPIRERPWRPFVRAACGDEWSNGNNGRPQHAHTISPVNEALGIIQWRPNSLKQ